MDWRDFPNGIVVASLFNEDGPPEIEVKEAAPVALVSLEVLAQADPHLMEVQGDTITIHAVNGEFVYRVVGWHRDNYAAPGHLEVWKIAP